MGRDQGDWRGAGSFIEAAGCSVQRNRLEEGVWDEKGVFYAVPVWCCSAPVDVVAEGEEVDEGEKEGERDGDVTEAEGEEDTSKGLVGIQDVEGDVADEKVVVLGSQETGKGKGKERSSLPAKPKDPIKIKARLSDRGTDVVVLVDKEDAVKLVVRRLVEEADVSFAYDAFAYPPTRMIYSKNGVLTHMISVDALDYEYQTLLYG